MKSPIPPSSADIPFSAECRPSRWLLFRNPLCDRSTKVSLNLSWPNLPNLSSHATFLVSSIYSSQMGISESKIQSECCKPSHLTHPIISILICHWGYASVSKDSMGEFFETHRGLPGIVPGSIKIDTKRSPPIFIPELYWVECVHFVFRLHINLIDFIHTCVPEGSSFSKQTSPSAKVL